MRRNEFAIGDYITAQNSVEADMINDATRMHMITLLETLNNYKCYKEETLYLAVSLCDRYLSSLSKKNNSPTCFILLAITATVVAAKLEQPRRPRFSNMVNLVKSHWEYEVQTSDISAMELTLITELDFNL